MQTILRSIAFLTCLAIATAEVIHQEKGLVTAQGLIERVTILEKTSAPLGTIIASVLPPSLFIGEFDAATSKWAPADGKDYKDCDLKVSIPDLRGMFLRGVNYTDLNDTISQREDKFRDPNEDAKDAKAGKQRLHKLGPHTHPLKLGSLGKYDKQSKLLSVDSARVEKAIPQAKGLGVGIETAPTHTLVHYYVRINL